MDIKVNQVSQPTPVEQTKAPVETDGTFKFTLSSKKARCPGYEALPGTD